MTARILIVDGVPASARLLEANLQAEYCQVVCAGDGFEALERARSWQPELILLGIMTPDMDGYACCRKLKGDAQTRHIPVVMITAPDEPAERSRGIEAGADDFLTRPAELELLMARVRGLVRLKRLLDEWQAHSETARALGLAGDWGEAPSIEGVHALVIDDWEAGAQNVQDTLARIGVTAGRARNEAGALALCSGIRFDLIVVNLCMEEEDPLRVIAGLRTADATRAVPVLMLARPEERQNLLRGFELGANDWLTLPLDENELRARVRNQILGTFYQDQLRTEVGTTLGLIDPLTGLHNQRYLTRHLPGLLAGPAQQDLALLMIDVDRFQAVNDDYGHAVGDLALRCIAATLRGNIRGCDSAARYGGEEFVVVMPGATQAEALSTAERLRAAIEALPFEPAPGRHCRLTISIGVACTHGAAPTQEALLRAGDQALYRAKRAGRNRVSLAGTPA